MKNKKMIWLAGITLIGIAIFFSYHSMSKKNNSQHPAIQVVLTLQKAIKDKDIEKLWSLVGRIKRRIPEDDYYNFREGHQNWFREHPDEVQAFINASLGEVKVITPNRVWIKSGPSNLLKGFYMVKENGEWKYESMGPYIKKIYKDTRLMSEAIRGYYNDKGYLPYVLNDLVPDYIARLPLDPYSDEEKTYSYEVLEKTAWKFYSVGMDGRDDFGLLEYDLSTNDFSIGDIIKEYRIEE